MISAYHAYGIIAPGWQRPVFQASLEEQDATGHEVTIGLDKTLTMNREDGSARPTSFTFFEEHRMHCLPGTCSPIPETALFIVKTIRTGACGSTFYIAQEFVPADLQGNVTRNPRTLQVVDHSTRLCEDYQKFGWEATLINSAGQDGTRTLFGNPEPVVSVQTNPFVHNY